MISDKEKYSLINKLKSHTESTVKKIEKQFLPVFHTGKIFKVKQYHFLDKWYVYAGSADEPSKTFSIIYVDEMPYKNLKSRESQNSFISNLPKMVRDNEIYPFLLFINNRFVPWDRIDVIHDFSNTYLKVYGEQYLYDYIKDIKMLILPYNVTYVGKDTDFVFSENYEALRQYVNDKALFKNDILYTELPSIDTDYTIKNKTYNIGYFMYNQIKLKMLGLLSKDRYDKLRKLPVIGNVYKDDVVIKTSYTTINIFDKDSYNHGDLDSLKNANPDNLLFSFTSDGLLSDNGEYNLYLIDSDEITIQRKDVQNNYYGENARNITLNNLYSDNFIVFKNGMICTDYKIDLYANNYKIYDIDKTIDYNLDGTTFNKTTNNKLSIFLFYNKDEYMINNKYPFYNQAYIADKSYDYFINKNNIGYIEEINDVLDFVIEDSKLYEDNFSDALNEVINFNPLLLNKLNKTSVYMKCMTGAEVNETLLVSTFGNHNGLRIPRMRFDKDRETYAIVFVNGEIIDNYCDMIALSNYFFIPRDGKFKDSDTIEVVYFLNIDNNELSYKYANQYINHNDLKLFSTNVDKSLLVYPDVKYDFEYIAFPVYKENDNGETVPIDNTLVKDIVAVSRRKFIYQRLYVDKKAYKIRLDKRFRYCDNQKQYALFINGRRVRDEAFLITIPKISRPFDYMYLYTTQFVTKNDRVELFYLPEEFMNINKDDHITISSNGYIECDKTKLSFPLNTNFFMFFVNGKKIPKSDMKNISTNSIRLINDPKSTNEFTVIPVCREYIPEVESYLQDHSKLSSYENLINIIKNNNNLGYDELDKLFNIFINVSNIEELFKPDVAKIAIINEIVRDFWVTSGYDYNKSTFVYDYEMDEYIVKDNENDDYYILPALDARQEINIIKDDIHTLFFQFMDNMPEYFEYGYSINNPLLSWEYADAYGTLEIEWQKLNNINLDQNARSYQVEEIITNDKSYTLNAFDGFSECETVLNIKFCNAIYYGMIDEDKLDNRKSDTYHNNPLGIFNDADIIKSLQPTVDLSLINTIVGNNKYFVYAAPKRLVYDNNGKALLTFFLPIIDIEPDDKTVPVLTNGKYEVENIIDGEIVYSDNLVKLDKYSMEKLAEINYTNKYGYTEPYVIFKANGFFTRLYDNTPLTISVKENK